ncbi:MAG: adenosylmethionine decarboxylase [Alphaproteobacteria bacterium]|nr:adenosylmethionine decarboxylase [Alphaproteobacteria bacterium]
MNTHETDFFSKCEKTGDEYAGRHILADFWDTDNMGDLAFIQEAIERSARAAGATILHSYYHPFGEGMGVSGVTVLSESHISIHTWPERNFASLDIFMCGACDPDVALAELVRSFKPGSVERSLNRRGVIRAVAELKKPARKI